MFTLLSSPLPDWNNQGKLTNTVDRMTKLPLILTSKRLKHIDQKKI